MVRCTNCNGETSLLLVKTTCQGSNIDSKSVHVLCCCIIHLRVIQDDVRYSSAVKHASTSLASSLLLHKNIQASKAVRKDYIQSSLHVTHSLAWSASPDSAPHTLGSNHISAHPHLPHPRHPPHAVVGRTALLFGPKKVSLKV